MQFPFKLIKRVQIQGPVGPYEHLEFKDAAGKSHYAKMESDALDAWDDDKSLVTIEYNSELQEFLNAHFDLLHYYMD